MWKNIGYEQCLSFINCQLRPGTTGSLARAAIRPSITISRMTGSGGRSVASLLTDYLTARTPADCHWTVFDKNLIERVLEDHHLPKRLAEYMPEGHRAMLGDMLEELLGMHPSSWTLVQKTSETILRLVKVGCVILVGRGANVVTSKLENVFHVRLVGSLEKRTKRVQEAYSLDEHHALKFIAKEDKGRRRFLKEHFDTDIDDPLLYHLIINTDRIRYEDAAQLIGNEVIRRYHLERPVHAVAA